MEITRSRSSTSIRSFACARIVAGHLDEHCGLRWRDQQDAARARSTIADAPPVDIIRASVVTTRVTPAMRASPRTAGVGSRRSRSARWRFLNALVEPRDESRLRPRPARSGRRSRRWRPRPKRSDLLRDLVCARVAQPGDGDGRQGAVAAWPNDITSGALHLDEGLDALRHGLGSTWWRGGRLGVPGGRKPSITRARHRGRRVVADASLMERCVLSAARRRTASAAAWLSARQIALARERPQEHGVRARSRAGRGFRDPRARSAISCPGSPQRAAQSHPRWRGYGRSRIPTLASRDRLDPDEIHDRLSRELALEQHRDPRRLRRA